MAKLSIVISAFNSEKTIGEVLESVKFADEIVFVDNSSTDKTVEIAKKYTSKIFTRPNNPMLNINKNFGISKASGDWILVIDSDEIVTPELQEEIKDKLAKSNINGFWIPRKNIIFGKWIKHTGWYPDHQLRLIRKGRGKFPEKHVHEMIEIDGKVSYLKNPIVHYNYDSISQFLEKTTKIYAPNEADQLIARGYKFSWQDAIRFPLGEFLSRYFAREGYKDGFHGLMLSLLMAFYHLIVFAMIWERQKFQEPESKNLLVGVEKEFEKGYKELNFWFSKEKGKRNLIGRFLRWILNLDK